MRPAWKNLVLSAALASLALPLLACGEAPRQFVSIEFGSYPEELEGETVFINGQAAGTLDRDGQATNRAFPVEVGEHEVRISHPRMRMEPAHVRVSTRGEQVRLMANIVEHFENGRLVPTIVLE